MKPRNDDPPYKIRFRSLLAVNDDAPTDDLDQPYYNLRDEVTLRAGDTFFDTERRICITVEDVMEKHHVGNRGGTIGDPTVVLKVSTDDPEDGRPDSIRHNQYRASQFIEHLREGRLIPHKQNDYVPEELQR